MHNVLRVTMQCLDIADFLSFCRRCRQAKLIEAIRFKVEQRMEGARKDRHVTQNTMPQLVAQ